MVKKVDRYGDFLPEDKIWATVITAPEPFNPSEHGGKFSFFLAGAIDMGAAVNWQAQVIQHFERTDCVIINPRRKRDFRPDDMDEQILWELDALEKVDAILMWFPKDAKAPISFFESGIYLRHPKLLIGAEEGFYRRRNLELTTHRYGVNLFWTLSDEIEAMGDRIQEHNQRLRDGR